MTKPVNTTGWLSEAKVRGMATTDGRIAKAIANAIRLKDNREEQAVIAKLNLPLNAPVGSQVRILAMDTDSVATLRKTVDGWSLYETTAFPHNSQINEKGLWATVSHLGEKIVFHQPETLTKAEADNIYSVLSRGEEHRIDVTSRGVRFFVTCAGKCPTQGEYPERMVDVWGSVTGTFGICNLCFSSAYFSPPESRDQGIFLNGRMWQLTTWLKYRCHACKGTVKAPLSAFQQGKVKADARCKCGEEGWACNNPVMIEYVIGTEYGQTPKSGGTYVSSKAVPS